MGATDVPGENLWNYGVRGRRVPCAEGGVPVVGGTPGEIPTPAPSPQGGGVLSVVGGDLEADEGAGQGGLGAGVVDLALAPAQPLLGALPRPLGAVAVDLV